jgi:predicted permease
MPYQTLLPIFAYFLIGFLLRFLGLANREQAAFLFRIVFYVTLPALVFLSIADAELSHRTILLPVAGITVNLVCASAALLYVRVIKLDNHRAGAVVLGAGIMNTLFVFPFILAVLGQVALADAFLFDLGNAIFVGTIAYSISLYFGKTAGESAASYLVKTIRAPIFVAIAAALIVNTFQVAVPPTVNNILSPLGAAAMPLVLIAVGISFSTAGLSGSLTITTILLRMLLGLIAGLLIVWLFGFTGVTAAVVVTLAAAPIGFNSVALASLGRLDTEQAASALSVSVAIGVLSTTLLLVIAVQLSDAGL